MRFSSSLRRYLHLVGRLGIHYLEVPKVAVRRLWVAEVHLGRSHLLAVRILFRPSDGRHEVEPKMSRPSATVITRDEEPRNVEAGIALLVLPQDVAHHVVDIPRIEYVDVGVRAVLVAFAVRLVAGYLRLYAARPLALLRIIRLEGSLDHLAAGLCLPDACLQEQR